MINDIKFEFKRSLCGGLYSSKIKTSEGAIDLGTVDADDAEIFKKELLDAIEWLDEIIAIK